MTRHVKRKPRFLAAERWRDSMLPEETVLYQIELA